jgi:hypothetical protein
MTMSNCSRMATWGSRLLLGTDTLIAGTIYFEDEFGRRMSMKRMTKDEMRRIAADKAQLPDLLRDP